jgi:hypothetical protein
MVSVPFLLHKGVIESIHGCIGLLCVNTIYFLRAKTEERHLSRDPVYVEYALWMNDRGVLRFLNRIPILKHIFVYKPPPAATDYPVTVYAGPPAEEPKAKEAAE